MISVLAAIDFAQPRDIAGVGVWTQSPSGGDMPEKATFVSKPFSAEILDNDSHEKLPDAKKAQPDDHRGNRTCQSTSK